MLLGLRGSTIWPLIASVVGPESGGIAAQLVQGTHGTELLQPGGVRVAVGHAWIVDVAAADAVAGGLIVQTQWVLLLLLGLWVLIAQLQNLQKEKNTHRTQESERAS